MGPGFRRDDEIVKGFEPDTIAPRSRNMCEHDSGFRRDDGFDGVSIPTMANLPWIKNLEI
jgi:hypothetical protein